MKQLITVGRFTVLDLYRNRSMLALLAAGVLFVLVLRGCYGGTYVVNNRNLDPASVSGSISRIGFHLIALGALVIAALLSMHLFTRDAGNGGTVMILSRPVCRRQYVLGRIGGVWVSASLYMSILHGIMLLIARLKAGYAAPHYLAASAVCSVNILFMCCLVSLLSLKMPDFMAAFAGIAVAVVSFVSDGAHHAMHHLRVTLDPSPWRALFPKLGGLQHWAVSTVHDGEFHPMGPLHPILNVLAYAALFVLLAVLVFRKREI